MFVNVNEVVDVIVIFKKNKVFPSAINWNKKIYKIEKVNLVHSVNDGRKIIHYFSVSDSVNSFKLAFDSFELKWNLEEVYFNE